MQQFLYFAFLSVPTFFLPVLYVIALEPYAFILGIG